MYRAKDSLLPIQYYNRLPKHEQCDVAYIVDPCIATANTIHAVVSILKKWGARKIVVVAAIGARQGVERLLELHPSVDVRRKPFSVVIGGEIRCIIVYWGVF